MGVDLFLPMFTPTGILDFLAFKFETRLSTPLLLNPKRLITALDFFNRKSLGFVLPD